MREREPGKEIINKGELYFLWHPGTENTFSGYGLTTRANRKDFMVGVLMVDRPRPADSDWLKSVEDTFGDYLLVPMTESGERGIVCQMQIDSDSLAHLHLSSFDKTAALTDALKPLLDHPPNPSFFLAWDVASNLWKSEFALPSELPPELRAALEQSGYGCLAVETNVGVIHVCHAPDNDIAGFANKPVSFQWQLVKMPTAPLLRLEMKIMDQPLNPFKFESFLNVADEEQAMILNHLANQDRLYLAFYGDDLTYHYTKTVQHDEQQWQQLDEIVGAAQEYWQQLPTDKRDFDKAKADFMRWYI